MHWVRQYHTNCRAPCLNKCVRCSKQSPAILPTIQHDCSICDQSDTGCRMPGRYCNTNPVLVLSFTIRRRIPVWLWSPVAIFVKQLLRIISYHTCAWYHSALNRSVLWMSVTCAATDARRFRSMMSWMGGSFAARILLNCIMPLYWSFKWSLCGLLLLDSLWRELYFE